MARLIQICFALLAFSTMVSAAPCQDGNSASNSMDESNNSTGTSNHVTNKPMDSQMISGNDKKVSTDPCGETICDDAHDSKQAKTTNNDTSDMTPDSKQAKTTNNDTSDMTPDSKQAKTTNNDTSDMTPDSKQVKTTNNDTSDMTPDSKQVNSTQEEPCDDNDKASLGAKSKVTSTGNIGSSVNQLQNGLVNIAAGDHIGTKNVDISHIISNIASPRSNGCDACVPSDPGSQFKSVNQVQNGLVNVAASDHIGTDNVGITKIVHNVL
ncbi:unnamed protein product [Rhizopus stolonifer]